jgi:outer membrane protein with beta-barrel domain
MDFSYYFPWKYLGVRFQGAGFSLSTGTFTVTESLNGVRQVSRSGSISTSVGVITTDLILRLPLDDFWPGVHLAPYAMGGFGAIFGGGGGDTINTRFPELNQRFANASSSVRSRVLGNIGGGLEYRFTPHWGIFGEAGYNVVDGPKNNFVQANFGFRFAF